MRSVKEPSPLKVHFEEVEIGNIPCPACNAKLLLPMGVLPFAFCPKCGRYFKMSFECRYCHELFNRISADGLCSLCQTRAFTFGEN